MGGTVSICLYALMKLVGLLRNASGGGEAISRNVHRKLRRISLSSSAAAPTVFFAKYTLYVSFGNVFANRSIGVGSSPAAGRYYSR